MRGLFQKLGRLLLEPSLRLYFVFLLLFAAVSALFSVAVAACVLVFVVELFVC